MAAAQVLKAESSQDTCATVVRHLKPLADLYGVRCACYFSLAFCIELSREMLVLMQDLYVMFDFMEFAAQMFNPCPVSTRA